MVVTTGNGSVTVADAQVAVAVGASGTIIEVAQGQVRFTRKPGEPGVLVSAGLDLGDATDRIHAGRRGSLSGPLAGRFGGADISYFVRFLVAGVLYVAPSRPSRRVQGDS